MKTWILASIIFGILLAILMCSKSYQEVRAEKIENYICTKKEKISCAINGFVMGFLLWPFLLILVVGIMFEGVGTKCR